MNHVYSVVCLKFNLLTKNILIVMHPFVKILCFITLLLLSNLFSSQLIWLLCLLVTLLALKLDFNKFLRVIKRMRWLFISIFIIYAFGTPGEYIQYFPNNYAPTFEGCSLGALQIVKLVIALASLSIIFATSSMQELMVGLYMLLSPLKLLGLNVARFSARLLLTLDYVEELAAIKKFNFDVLDELHSSVDNLQEQKMITLQFPAFRFIDKLLIIIMFSIVILLSLKALT